MTVDSMRQLMRSSGVPTKLARAGIEQGLAENRRVLESLTGDNRTQSDAEATQRDAMLLSWADMVSNPRGAAADTARQLPMSTPGLVTGGTAAGAGAAGGPVVATLAFASGVALGQVPVEFGAWVVGEVEKQAGDATDRDAVLAVLNDEEFMTRVMGEALRKGVSQAAVEGMFAMAGGKVVKAIGPAGQGAGLARRAAQRGGAFAVDSAAQMAGAGAGEAVGQFAATGEVDWMEVMRETQGELAGGMATTTAAIVSQQSFTGTAKGSKAVADMIEATRSVSANEALSRTVEAIKTDITAGRSPEAMLELLKTKSPEGEAYFQADKWNELWNA